MAKGASKLQNPGILLAGATGLKTLSSGELNAAKPCGTCRVTAGQPLFDDIALARSQRALETSSTDGTLDWASFSSIFSPYPVSPQCFGITPIFVTGKIILLKIQLALSFEAARYLPKLA